MTRRDPSVVITVNDTLFVYYTRTTGVSVGFGSDDPEAKVFPWDKSEVWNATSTDEWEWKERGRVVAGGLVINWTEPTVVQPGRSSVTIGSCAGINCLRNAGIRLLSSSPKRQGKSDVKEPWAGVDVNAGMVQGKAATFRGVFGEAAVGSAQSQIYSSINIKTCRCLREKVAGGHSNIITGIAGKRYGGLCEAPAKTSRL